MSDNKGKVIPFPKPKVEVPVQTSKEPQPKPRKKIQGAVVSGALALVVAANLYLRETREPVTEGGRQIASVRGLSDDDVWQRELVKDLSTKPLRGVATAGTQPQIIDELQFGELKGQYKFEFEGGRIKSIALSDATSQAIELKSPEAFITRYKNVWQVPFETAVGGPERADGKTQIKTVRLIRSGRPFGEVEFTFHNGNQLQNVLFKTTN